MIPTYFKKYAKDRQVDTYTTFQLCSNENVVLIDGSTILWEDIKANGFDYINITIITADGKIREICDAELA